jgi:hypothetical protein
MSELFLRTGYGIHGLGASSPGSLDLELNSESVCETKAVPILKGTLSADALVARAVS